MVTIIIGVLGGLALFLYGMKIMSDGLERMAGNKLKPLLEKLTSNKFIAVIAGIIVTVLVQSSSATIVMLVSFVNSGIMTLEQTVYVIFGANIGTTFTTQLIALDLSNFASLAAIIGVVMIVFIKNNKINSLGMIIAGMGILFMGMGTMSAAVAPLKEMESFTSLMTAFTNPLLGILVGTFITAIIQSSAASLGILQALSVTGAINLSNSFYLMLGANMGTCITGILASLGGKKDAKRTAMIHLLFNAIGMVAFVIIIRFIPYLSFIENSSPYVKTQIANANTVYKVIVSLLLFPFGKLLAKLATIIIPDNSNTENKESNLISTSNISYGQIGTAIVVGESMKKQIRYMMGLVKRNLYLGMTGLINYSKDGKEEIEKNEDLIDKGNRQIVQYMNDVSKLEMSQGEYEVCLSMFRMSNDLERMGDHACNLIEYLDWGSDLDKAAKEELELLNNMMIDGFRHLYNDNLLTNLDAVDALKNIEESVDILTEQYRVEELKRLERKECTIDNTVEYSNILVDVERVFDHLTNLLEECRNHDFLLFDQEETNKGE